MKKFTVLLALSLIATEASAQYQNRTYYGPSGNVTGRSTTSSSGQTTFYGSSGSVTGRACSKQQRHDHFLRAEPWRDWSHHDATLVPSLTFDTEAGIAQRLTGNVRPARKAATRPLIRGWQIPSFRDPVRKSALV